MESFSLMLLGRTFQRKGAQCQMWDSDWLFSETQVEECQWIQKWVRLEPGLQSLWLTLTCEMSFRIWSSETAWKLESMSLEWTLEAKFSVVSKGSSLNYCLIVSIFSWKNQENDLAASWGIISGRELDLFSLFSSVLRREDTVLTLSVPAAPGAGCFSDSSTKCTVTIFKCL